MAVEFVRHIAWRQWGDLLHTADINLPPSTSYASCALTGSIGAGRSYCGIMALRTRPVWDGAEAVEKFGDLFLELEICRFSGTSQFRDIRNDYLR
jgi:hypothetical protein